MSNYTLKEMYEDTNFPNDTLSFYVFSKKDGLPVDRFAVRRRGNKYFVRGHWRGYQDAKNWASQILHDWFS